MVSYIGKDRFCNRGGCKLCIAIFAFISGYAFYKNYFSSNNTSISKRLIKFLIIYWTMLVLIAAPYLAFQGNLSLKMILCSFLAFLHNDDLLMLSFSWYVKVYVLVLLILPFIKKISNKIKDWRIEALILVFMPICISKYLPDSEIHYTTLIIFLLSTLRLILTWYPIFHIGTMFGKYKVFENIQKMIPRKNIYLVSCLSLLGCCTSILIRKIQFFSLFTDAICVSIFCISAVVFIKTINNKLLNKLFTFLGEYSFQYWLLSGMFFLNTVELQWILFVPKLSILILIWSFILITPVAILTSTVSKKIIRKLLPN